jgi:hypothetical protein
VAVSNFILFANPNAPLYPRLAQGKSWNEVSLFKLKVPVNSSVGCWILDSNSCTICLPQTKLLFLVSLFFHILLLTQICYVMQMTVTWTSGYNINEAVPFVEWGLKGQIQTQSPAGTLTIDQNSMCGTIHFHLLMIAPHCIVLLQIAF